MAFIPPEDRPGGEPQPERPRRPDIPRAVLLRIEGAEDVVQKLYVAMVARLDNPSPQEQLEIMDIQRNLQTTLINMAKELSDDTLKPPAQDPQPYVDSAKALEYVNAVSLEHLDNALKMHTMNKETRMAMGKVITEPWERNTQPRYGLGL